MFFLGNWYLCNPWRRWLLHGNQRQSTRKSAQSILGNTCYTSLMHLEAIVYYQLHLESI